MRTRSAAAALAASGHVRVNGARIDAASRAVRPGDVITVALDRRVRVMKVVGFGERRGAAEAAEALYQEMGGPPAAQSAALPRLRAPGLGRPTKRDRRALDRLRTGEEE